MLEANSDLILKFFIKCDFLIKNLQPAPTDSGEPIVNIKYWTSEPYTTNYFNDYLFFSFKNDRLNRVIVNGQKDSSCWFHRFIHVHLKVLGDSSLFIR